MLEHSVSIIQDKNNKVLGVHLWNTHAKTPGEKNDRNDILRNTFNFSPGTTVFTMTVMEGEYMVNKDSWGNNR